jgi:hypothetical protein
VDLVISADPEATQIGMAPTVGFVRDLLPEFQRMAQNLIAGVEFPVNRIALGGQYFLSARSREDSYDQIAKLTKSINVDTNRARELIFRINWPVQSGVVDGLMLNRLTTFNSMMFGQMVVQNQSGQVTVMPTSGDVVYVTSLETDHNTAPDQLGAFETDRLMPIFDELVRLTSENLAEGEIR